MPVIIERTCGMDIHKDSITTCNMTPEGKVIQTFSTFMGVEQAPSLSITNYVKCATNFNKLFP